DELKMHPTVKPVALNADTMRDCSRRGSIILDAFAGSGSSIMAAEQIGRRAFCIEIDPRYVDVAIRRWQRFTGCAAMSETRLRTRSGSGSSSGEAVRAGQPPSPRGRRPGPPVAPARPKTYHPARPASESLGARLPCASRYPAQAPQ